MRAEDSHCSASSLLLRICSLQVYCRHRFKVLPMGGGRRKIDYPVYIFSFQLLNFTSLFNGWKQKYINFSRVMLILWWAATPPSLWVLNCSRGCSWAEHPLVLYWCLCGQVSKCQRGALYNCSASFSKHFFLLVNKQFIMTLFKEQLNTVLIVISRQRLKIWSILVIPIPNLDQSTFVA